MSRRRIGWIALAAVTLGAVVVLFPAAADWLVTKDGDRIETESSWRVEGRLVVFKRPNGTYASIRLSDMDLEASERLTRAKADQARRQADAARKEEVGPERRESVARLTEKDLPPVGRAPEKGDGQSGGDAADAEEDSSPAGLTVATWREVSNADAEISGISFTGEIHNPTAHMAISVGLRVTLYDAEDEEIASTAADLTGDVLPPAKTGAFRARFPGVFDYARAEFDLSGTLLRSGTGTEPEADGGQG